MDLHARSIAQKPSEALGQPVIVDIRAGATGVIAAEIVMKSAPDGYTLLAAPGSALTATPYRSAHRYGSRHLRQADRASQGPH